MRHCIDFEPLDVWFLKPSNKFFKRKINIGFCPICGKPVAEYWQFKKSGKCYFQTLSGIKANEVCKSLISEIDFKMSTLTLAKMRQKLYGWLYGINKENNNQGTIEQYASDFYGNTELVKTLKNKL